MQPVIHLDQVTIKDLSKKQMLNDVMGDYKRKGQYSSLKPSVGSVLSSPITGLYEFLARVLNRPASFRNILKKSWNA
jgi:hypothetical protein